MMIQPNSQIDFPSILVQINLVQAELLSVSKGNWCATNKITGTQEIKWNTRQSVWIWFFSSWRREEETPQLRILRNYFHIGQILSQSFIIHDQNSAVILFVMLSPHSLWYLQKSCSWTVHHNPASLRESRGPCKWHADVWPAEKSSQRRNFDSTLGRSVITAAQEGKEWELI